MDYPIYLLESKNRQVLAETFMRFQEYYESPEFKGRVFSVEDFAHWYAQKYGSFSYSRDWYGFNIPSNVVGPFRCGQFDPLTPLEQNLINICKNDENNFYIIGVTPDAEYFSETVKHEFVHGAFHVNKYYREDVTSYLKDQKLKLVNSALSKMGYHQDVFEDEANAYILVEPESLSEFVSERNTEKVRLKLDNIFEKYFKFSMIKSNIESLINRTKHIVI